MTKYINEVLEDLIKEGSVKALCPKCQMPLTTIKVKKCDVCGSKIVLDDVILQLVEKSQLN